MFSIQTNRVGMRGYDLLERKDQTRAYLFLVTDSCSLFSLLFLFEIHVIYMILQARLCNKCCWCTPTRAVDIDFPHISVRFPPYMHTFIFIIASHIGSRK